MIEDADKSLSALEEAGIEVIVGNGVRQDVLQAANIAEARRLIIAIPNAFEAGQIVMQAKAANPEIEIIARAHFDAEVDHLTGLGVGTIIMGEREIARAIVEKVTGARPLT